MNLCRGLYKKTELQIERNHMKLINLRLEHKKNPIGIDNRNPYFEWNISENEKCWNQSAYQILVSDNLKELEDNNARIWDSKKQCSTKMTDIIYRGLKLESDTRYYWKVRVWDQYDNNSMYSEAAFFETGLMSKEDWKGRWIGEEEDFINHIFRKPFQLKKEIQRASVHICGLGHYELFLNGQRVGDSVLAPGWTNYHKSCLYNTYDVTDVVKSGKNCFGLYLGDGMYNVKKKRYVYFERTFGNMKFLFQLHVVYQDGSTEDIVSDEGVHMSESPLTYSGIYGGEDYDGRLEQSGFSTEGFKEGDNWKAARIAEPPKGELNAEFTPPMKVMERYKPVEVIKSDSQTYLYDLGKNFSGWVSIRIKTDGECSGKQIIMRPAEILTEDKKPDQRVTGDGYCWNYICNEKEKQSYRPKFTYYGFRYVQVEGAVPIEFAGDHETKPIIESLVGEFIYPDVKKRGKFECSNDLFNQIHQIIDQAVLSNMKSVFTDCPHREKLGWLEETHLIGPSIMCGYDVRSLYQKIEKDMAEAQHENGLVPDICPEYVKGFEKWHYGYLDSPEWGSACIINPWYLYKKYGDTKVFTKYYEVMRRYLDHLTDMTHHHILHHGLGDWLDIGINTPHSQNTPVPVIATSIYYYDIIIMKKIAHILGKAQEEDYFIKLLEEVKKEYNAQFFDGQTYRYATGSQAAQAMSLATGLVDQGNEVNVLEYLVKDIEGRNYATTAGDVGHPFVMTALTMYGRSDIIEKMTNITDAPGYGYQVKCGATTLTEEWDGPDPNRTHGSQNHFMLGSIEEWFYCGLAGLPGVRGEEEFDQLVIKPYFSKEINHVKASVEHPYGIVSVEWTRKSSKIQVVAEVPPNTKGIFISEIDGSRREFFGRETFIIDSK